MTTAPVFEPARLTSGHCVQMESVSITAIIRPKIITYIRDCLLSAQFSSLETGPTHPLGCPQERTGASILSRSDISGLTRRGPPVYPWVIIALENGINTAINTAGFTVYFRLPGPGGYHHSAEEETGQEVKGLASGHKVN